MPEFIENVETQDTYTDALTLGGSAIGNVSQITFSVFNNSVFVQFWVPVPGQPGKSVLEPTERLYLGGTVSVVAQKVAGVQFRSAVAGEPGRIIAEMDFATDPIIFGGTIGGVSLDPSGQVDPCPCGTPGGSLVVTDGSTTVNPTTELDIGVGILLSDFGAGVAEIEANLSSDDGSISVDASRGAGQPVDLSVNFPSPPVDVDDYVFVDEKNATAFRNQTTYHAADFTSIAQDARHLRIWGIDQCEGDLLVQFNGDTSNHYRSLSDVTQDASGVVTAAPQSTALTLGIVIPRPLVAGASAGVTPRRFVIDIPYYRITRTGGFDDRTLSAEAWLWDTHEPDPTVDYMHRVRTVGFWHYVSWPSMPQPAISRITLSDSLGLGGVVASLYKVR